MPMRAILYSASADERHREVELDEELVRSLVDDTMLWVHLDGHDEEALRQAAETLGLPDEAIAGALAGGTRAELERFPEAFRLRVVAVTEDENGRISPSPVDIVAARNRALTIHDGRLEPLDEFERGTRGETVLGRLEVASFVSAIVDSIIADFLRVVEDVERRVDALDEEALKTADPEVFLRDVVVLRRRVGSLRRALAPLRVALAPLARPDAENPEFGKPWPGLLDRLERAIDAVENARELIIGSFDVFMARHAERTNDIMKTLTILNAVLLPAAVVAGVMGMNFRLGFFDAPSNFWIVLGAMLLLATAIIGFSRWRHWI
jgi:Mg2+ and Co2+ transporter CorA